MKIGGYNMKCPYCGAEMEKGFITSLGTRNLYEAYGWHPEEMKEQDARLFGIMTPAEKLPRGKGKTGCFHLDGYRCAGCEKIIIDLKDDNI
ncbi:hypothetical protein SDC9_176216 [bioreactor metagenome]|uniref:DUF6487 domain-containing protein n=1 Tax=bioreactor metagenome TaxID=1076179 RepID=A0A645GPD4_9ZZZZ